MGSHIMGVTQTALPRQEASQTQPAAARAPDPSRIPSLDGLRAISVLLVIVFHMSIAGDAPAFFIHLSTFGVQVFFVISGYLITSLLLAERERLDRIDLKAFYLRRVFRIIPAAYGFLAVIFVFYWAAFRPVDIISTLTFTTNYDLGRPTVVAHFWSLGVEEQFYLLWPITLGLFFRQRLRILVWALCLSPFFIVALHFLHLNEYRALAFPTTYDTLAMGCLAAVLGSRLEFLRSRWFVLCGPLALLCQWPLWTTKLSGLVHVFFLWPAMHLFIAMFMVHAIYRPYWLLNVKPMVWIGTLSYSLYLWHQPFIAEPRLAHRFTLLWIFASAAASYYLLERPLLRLRKRLRKVPVGDVNKTPA